MGENFRSPYPDDFGYYRIGTPVNADLNRAAPTCPAFEMGMLEKEGFC
jgi:hypothetical protein